MKSKFGAMVLSLVLAFGLWMYVVTQVSPNSEWTYNDIKLQIDGETILRERNLIITGMSSDTVDLTLSGNRSDLNNLNSSNITLRVDMTKIYDPGTHKIDYSISFPSNVAGNAFTRVNQYPDSVTVTVERLERKPVPVVIIYQGKVDEGYVVRRGDIQLSNEEIQIAGPASVVSRITQAVITVNLDGQTESIQQDYKFTLCDQEGKPVDSHLITVNAEAVHVDLEIHRYKQVQLTATIVYGGGASPETATVTIDPAVIQISGSDIALEQVGDSINLGTINLADYETDTKLTFQIPTLDGIANDSGKTEVTVNLKFKGLETTEIAVEDFKITGVPQGHRAEVITEKLIIKVRGPANLISKLKPEDIIATVDFTNGEAGQATYRVTITFTEEFEALGALGKPSVTAYLQQTAK